MPWPVNATDDDSEEERLPCLGDERVVKDSSTAIADYSRHIKPTRLGKNERPDFQNFVDAITSCIYSAITTMSDMACGICDASKHKDQAISTFAYAV